MPARAAYSYAILRVMPRVERDEYINAGAVVHCPERRYLAAAVALDEARLLQLFPGADLPAINRHLMAIADLCAGAEAAGPLATLSMSERFHWAVAPRSTMVQASPLHSGLTDDPAAALVHLVDTMVRLPPPRS
ncbi:MAG TPA: DUF3037 domain-containing protein [Polyangia bacterium]